MKVIYLKPKTSFRNLLHSDSLFGLIIWGIEKVFPEKFKSILTRFKHNDPPFLISSALPYLENNGAKTLYFPKPAFKPMQFDVTPLKMDNYKQYKKINWLPWHIYDQLRTGKMSEAVFYEKEIWKDFENPMPYETLVIHNSIDRLTNTASGSGNLFPVKEYFMASGGLYFLLDIRDSQYESIFSGIFQFYEHIGFGGDAGIGKGQFKFFVEDFPYNLKIDSAANLTNLSFYLPSDSEIKTFIKNENDMWYKLVMRKGKVGGRLYVTGNVWKKTVNVFSEGSCFPKIEDQNIYGTFPVVKDSDAQSDFDIHYYGYALMLDYNPKEA